jgi:hypothetical protein
MNASVSIRVSRATALKTKALFGLAGLVVGVSLAAQPAHAAAPYVGGASTPTGKAFWVVQANGAVAGGLGFFGDARHVRLAQPISGIAATPTGKGYWLVAGDGGVFGFGDAKFFGSKGGAHLNKPVVAIASTKDGRGYWLVASDGGVFSFGDAKFYGSLGGKRLNEPIVGLTSTASGKGYRMVARDGGVFDFGDAKFYGSLGGRGITNVVGMARIPSGNGYWIVRKSVEHICQHGGCGDLAEPAVNHFGDAKDLRLYGPVGDAPVPFLVALDAVAIVADPVVQNYFVLGSEGHIAITCVFNGGCGF